MYFAGGYKNGRATYGYNPLRIKYLNHNEVNTMKNSALIKIILNIIICFNITPSGEMI